MPFCKKCGRLNDPNAKFCGFCGASFALSETIPMAQQLQQPDVQASPNSIPPPPPDWQQQPATYQQPATFQQQPAYLQPATQQPPPTYQQTPQPQPVLPTQTSPENVFGVILLRKPKSMGRYDSWTMVITSHRMIFALMTGQMITDAAMQARTQAKAEGKGFMGQWGDQLRATFNYTQKYLTMEPNATLAETPGNVAVDNASISEVKFHRKNINKGHQVQEHEFSVEIISAQGTYEFRMQERGEFVNLLKQVYGERVKMPFGYISSHGVQFKVGPF